MSKSKSPKSPASTAPFLDLSKTKELKPQDMQQLKDLIQAQNGGSAPAFADPGLQKKVNALKNVQLEMTKVEAKFYDELHELECKFFKLYEPFFEKRRKIVTGEHEPTEEEGKWALDEDEETKPVDETQKAIEPAKGVDAKEAKTEEKGIANFWLDTLQSFRITAELIHEVDEPILSHLQDIHVRLFDKQPYGYALDFHFSENPYFINKVLTKTYELTTEIDPKDPFSFEGPDLSKSIGCKIDWKEGKNVTVKLVKKKLKSKNKKAPPKIVTKEEEQESFFNFFKSLDEKTPSKALVKHNGGDDEDDDLDEEDSLELLRIADFEIGQYLREKVVPKAALYYSGELDGMEDEYDEEYDDEDGEGDDDDEDDEDDDDEEDDDDDDEDETEKTKKEKGSNKSHGKSGGKPAGGPKSGNGTEPAPAECKQS